MFTYSRVSFIYLHDSKNNILKNKQQNKNSMVPKIKLREQHIVSLEIACLKSHEIR